VDVTQYECSRPPAEIVKQPMTSRFLFGALLFLCISGSALAQAPTGYTKIGSEPANILTFNDGAVTSGQVWNYVVTAFNAAGESGPSNVVTGTTPNTTAVHENSLTWTAPVADANHGAATGYNIYRQQVLSPNPPGLGVSAQ
jgi:hypothetical protein